MFDLDGECNGYNIFDVEDWTDIDTDSYFYYGENNTTKKWKCADGSIINICDMTDKHLENSINYLIKKGSLSMLNSLEKEKRRRQLEKIIEEKTKNYKNVSCQFCGTKMILKMIKHYSDPDDGPGMGYSYEDFRLECKNCGALGPIIHTED